MKKDIQKIICLMGPTASGKSQLAMAVAEGAAVEIISVDSAMVYRGMDIGTAKPTRAEQQAVPHHLIDLCDPSESYSAGQFRQDALAAIADVLARGKVPLLVGGTMLYFYALQQGLAELPVANAAIRAEIAEMAAQHGWPYVYGELAKVDPGRAAELHPHDSQRISRALEIYQSSGETWESLKKAALQAAPYQFINLALWPEERQILHERISARWQDMLVKGFIEEVEKLFQRKDLQADLPAIRAVGYRQVWQYLLGEYDAATMSEKAIIATRQLAKRQLTWLRRWPDLQRLSGDFPQLLRAVKSYIS